jgi:hypothetical protein
LIRLQKDEIVWQHRIQPPRSQYDDYEAVILTLDGIPFPYSPMGEYRPKALADAQGDFERNGITCIIPAAGEWTIDLDELTKRWPHGRPYEWFTGLVKRRPRLAESDSGDAYIIFEFTKSNVQEEHVAEFTTPDLPPSISESFPLFQADYADSTKAA